MPSWNIHTAQVERLLAERSAENLGIGDPNAFLFGNYVPDIYLGYMVPGTTYRIDYRITHAASYSAIPVPNADKFWDDYLMCHRPASPAGLSLVLGAWAHLATDRIYNGRFRTFWETHDAPVGDELRQRKQGDFYLFGRSLSISTCVDATPELLEAARTFVPYSILADDAKRAMEIANSFVKEKADGALPDGRYRLLSAEWMTETFEACHERLVLWLETWQRLEAAGQPAHAADIRIAACLPPLTEKPFQGDGARE